MSILQGMEDGSLVIAWRDLAGKWFHSTNLAIREGLLKVAVGSWPEYQGWVDSGRPAELLLFRDEVWDETSNPDEYAANLAVRCGVE